MNLSNSITAHSRFARSINIERNASKAAIEGYLPTGRALDVIRRVGRSLTQQSVGRAFSITGPHGSGKSSLGVFLSGLTAPGRAAEYEAAMETLSAVEPETANLLVGARATHGASRSGFIQCVVTANREPVLTTVARAFEVGARRYFSNRSPNPVPSSWADPKAAAGLTSREVLQQLSALSAHAPVLLVIDEFGKNLESYADSGRDGDPYLLQELAEWAAAESGRPFVIITMQHLAFEEYVHETSTARRREWVKVQGRFEDIAYVETPSQARSLVSAAFKRAPGGLDRAIAAWVKAHRNDYIAVGLRELYDEGIVSRSYPIHPIALGVLPELCSRYGQNERTLFSFLAGPEPQAAPAFLSAASWTSGQNPPFIRLADVYDYFVASAGTMIGSAARGGRWFEVESRIRDTTGLGELELSALKSVGVLNLISAGGSIRASRAVLGLALADNPASEDVDLALHHLEDRGLITYRDFADEYRIWQGSDFDLKGTVELARRRCTARSLDELLNEAAPQAPLVAARHSQQHGTLRIFERRFSRLAAPDLVAPAAGSEWDGRVLLSVGREVPDLDVGPADKPLVVVVADSVEELAEAAVEAAALAEALKSADSAGADWVARRELIERFAVAQQRLTIQIEAVFESRTTVWHLLGTDVTFVAEHGPSRVLSDIADHAYSGTPQIPNEMIARRELTSQGAKARRLLIEGMINKPASPYLGISGFPPERAMYDAVLARSGLHVKRDDGSVAFQPPTDARFLTAWEAIQALFDGATGHRLEMLEIWRALQAPPIGLKDGPIPVLLVVALLLRQDDVAVYEHGTLVLALDDAVAERLVRNPGHFSVKNTGANSAARRDAVAKLAARLGYVSYSGAPTFLSVARHLYAQLRHLEPYAMATRTVSPVADAMRQAFRSASEPDRLIFHDLPLVFGLQPISPDRRPRPAAIDKFVDALAQTIDELEGAYPALLRTITTELARALVESPEGLRRSFSVHASALADSVLESRLRSFVFAACRDELDDREWLENLAMVVADAQAPKNWTDDTVERFRLAATEIGGAFRRVSALLSERKALVDEHGAALPIAITRLDGREGRMVLWTTEEDRKAVSQRLSSLLAEVSPLLGSREKAREALLAALLEGEIGADDAGASRAQSISTGRKFRHA